MPDPLSSDPLKAMARAVLQMADVAGMPDSFWQSDSRVKLARDALGVPHNGRHDYACLWMEEST